MNVRKYFNKDKNKEWINGFKETQSLFIHIPKAAGTSIAIALYGEDPWHYPYRDYRFLSKTQKQKLFKFAFIRNPYDRLLSTYLYSFKQIKSHPNTSIGFLTEYSTFESFVKSWINAENINTHYFFFPQTKYILDDNQQIGIDFLGRFETLQQDFNFVARKLGKKIELPEINKVKHEPYYNYYTPELAELVFQAYKDDFEMFDYPKEL